MTQTAEGSEALALRYRRWPRPRSNAERTTEADAWTMRLGVVAQAAREKATVEDQRLEGRYQAAARRLAHEAATMR